METWRPRIWRSSARSDSRQLGSMPSRRIWPPAGTALGLQPEQGRGAVNDLPLPDSPIMPTRSPAAIVKFDVAHDDGRPRRRLAEP